MNAVVSTLSQWLESWSENAFAYLILSPAFVLVGAMACWPLIGTFEASLHTDSLDTFIGAYVGIENYRLLISGQMDYFLVRPFFDVNAPLKSSLIVTFIIATVSVIFSAFFGVGQALILDKEFFGRSFARVLIILPWAFPIVIYGMVFFLFFQPSVGIGPEIFQQIGLASAPLANTLETTIVIIIAYTWRGAPFIGLMVLAGMQSIDRSLYDVAESLGASKWQTFKQVTLPLVTPQLLIGALFTMIAGLKIFGLVLTVTGNCGTVTPLSCLAYTAFVGQKYGTTATIGFVMALVIAIATIVFIVLLQRSQTHLNK
jgi:multiple sugar transport system permease protein